MGLGAPRSLLLLLLMAVLLVHASSSITFSSKLIHRFSEEMKLVRASRSENGSWPLRRSLDYYQVLVSSDFQRQKMKLGSQFQLLFPSEGSKTMSFGNDFGWLHYTWIDLGTPNVSFLVALDAGSDLLWVPCDCVQCAPLSASYYSTLVRHYLTSRNHYALVPSTVLVISFFLECSAAPTLDIGISFNNYIYSVCAWQAMSYDFKGWVYELFIGNLMQNVLRCSLLFGASIMQDRDLNEYSPSNSKTSKHISCSHRLCELGPNCKLPKQQCPYTIDYYTENTSSSGFLVEDILHLASGGGEVVNTSIQASVIIGCGMKQSGGYLDGVAPDGLMGLGFGEISVLSFLAKAGMIENTFSMCFDDDDSGRIFFGDKGPVTQQSTSFLPLDGKFKTYIIGVEACCIESSCLKQTKLNALVDSGTSFTFLPEKIYEDIATEFDTKINATRTSYEGYPWKYCYKTSPESTHNVVPSISLKFLPNNNFTIHNPVFMVYGEQGVVGFCLAIQPIDGDIGIIGQNFMTGYRMVFDRENLVLGWSRSKCQDLSDGKRMPLTPKGTPPNPLPATEQQSSPGGHAVAPAVAGRAPTKPSAASRQFVFTRSCMIKLLFLILLLFYHV